MSSKFVYVIYIMTTPEKLWAALTQAEFTRQYWFGVAMENAGAWKKGSRWKMTAPNGKPTDEGEVIESTPPSRLVLSWQHRMMPELEGEGPARATFDIEPQKGAVKLTVTHEIDRDKSKLIDAVSNGWPQILSALKSFLEMEKGTPGMAGWPKEG